LVIPLYVVSGVWLCFALAELGEFEEGLRTADEIVRLSESLNNPYAVAHTLWALGELCLKKGDLAQAETAAERGFQEAAAREIEIVHAAIGVTLGYTVALRGDLARGEALLDEALHRSERLGMAFLKTDVLVRLVEVRLWRGALTQASEGARQALEGARARGERGQEAWTLRLLAEIASRSEPPDDAATETRLVEARDLATALGMRPLVAHCHLGLGKLYRRTGEPEQAREHLTTATTMYREMDMRFWLEQAEAELRRD
jgi:tetratricopeptide (TPR) repeat protein